MRSWSCLKRRSHGMWLSIEARRTDCLCYVHERFGRAADFWTLALSELMDHMSARLPVPLPRRLLLLKSSVESLALLMIPSLPSFLTTVILTLLPFDPAPIYQLACDRQPTPSWPYLPVIFRSTCQQPHSAKPPTAESILEFCGQQSDTHVSIGRSAQVVLVG